MITDYHQDLSEKIREHGFLTDYAFKHFLHQAGYKTIHLGADLRSCITAKELVLKYHPTNNWINTGIFIVMNDTALIHSDVSKKELITLLKLKAFL